VKELLDFARAFAPSVLSVIETQVHRSRVEGLRHTLGYDKAFVVSSSGRSGGIGIFWNNEKKVEILPYSQYHIDTVITEADGLPWRLTCVYGEAQTRKRYKTWDMLKFIKSSTSLPWACMGDFNEVLHQSKHVGVQARIQAQIAGFREMADVCGFNDLGFEGRSWTFEKKVAGGSFCRVRLDRAFATSEWSSRFPLATVKNLTAQASYHAPILLTWRQQAGHNHRSAKRRFRYEVMWEDHESFHLWSPKYGRMKVRCGMCVNYKISCRASLVILMDGEGQLLVT
jgi:hypothetical protein